MGAGFIGRHLANWSLRQGVELRVLDHKECPQELLGKVVWIKGDLNDDQAVREVLKGAEVVYHLISSTVPGDVTDESRELIQNVVPSLRMLKICLEQQVRRVVFISSASVYGLQQVLPIPETAMAIPISSHGVHKLAIEHYLQVYKYQYGLDCKIMRLSNPYGPGQALTGRQGFIAIAIGRLLAGEPLMIRGDGSIIRDFIYIDDVADTLHRLGTTESKESLFNVGSGIGYSLNQVVATMERIAGVSIRVEHSENRFVDIPASILDISKETTILGKTDKISLEAGLRRTLEFHGLKVNAEQINR